MVFIYKIKFIILSGSILVLSSCSLFSDKPPKSWDSFSARLSLKLKEKVCMKAYEDGFGSDLSEEERQIAESFCECMNEEFQLRYPSPRDIPNPPEKEVMEEIAEECRILLEE